MVADYHEPHHLIVRSPDHELELRDLHARLASDKTRRAVAIGVLVLLGVAFVAGVAGIVVAGVEKVSTDPIERVLTPTITGLIGVLGGLFPTGGMSR